MWEHDVQPCSVYILYLLPYARLGFIHGADSFLATSDLFWHML